MALQDTDLLLVGRAGGSFRCTAQDLQSYVESGAAMTYRGTADFTASPVGQIDPATPETGDLYINTDAGNVNANWAGAAGTATIVGDRILFNGTEWELITSGSTPDVGVTDVSVTAPITDTGTAAEPNIGISAATNAAPGSVQLADDAGSAGDLTTSNASDVLIKQHFDELNRRIGVAAGGGITGITGTAPITASLAGAEATIGITVATTAAQGSVQLQDNITNNATNAATPNAVNSYAVPLDLSTLTELA